MANLTDRGWTGCVAYNSARRCGALIFSAWIISHSWILILKRRSSPLVAAMVESGKWERIHNVRIPTSPYSAVQGTTFCPADIQHLDHSLPSSHRILQYNNRGHISVPVLLRVNLVDMRLIIRRHREPHL